MRYEDVRDQIRSGDLLAWSHRGWGSLYDLQIQAIRVFDRTEYTHVGVAWCVAGRVFVVESVSSGVRIFPLSRLVPFYWLALGAEWSADAENFVIEHLGDRYSKWQALLAFFQALHGGADRAWQCAEFAARLLLKLGCDLGGRYVPSSLVQSALERGAQVVFVM